MLTNGFTEAGCMVHEWSKLFDLHRQSLIPIAGEEVDWFGRFYSIKREVADLYGDE